MNIRRHAGILVALPLIAALSGCTEEKAQALLNSALDFQAKSSQTVDALEELFLASVTNPMQRTQADLVNDARAAAKKLAASGTSVTLQQVTGILSLNRLREQGNEKIRKELGTVRTHSERLALALERLPRGRLFVDESTIACVAEVAARLTLDMATYGERLATTPIPLETPIRQRFGEFKRAAKANDGAKQTQTLNDLAAVLDEQDRLNKQAIGRALVAAESGAALVKAATDYNTRTLADILSLAQEALDVANRANVFDTARINTRLGKIRTDLSTDPYWKVTLEKRLDEKGTKCNPATTEG